MDQADTQASPEVSGSTNRRKTAGQFGRFLIIGGFAFVIDVAVMYLFIHFGLTAGLARMPSTVAAVSFTYLCNTFWTFKNHHPDVKLSPNMRSFWGYVFVQGIGLVINLSTFWILLAVLADFTGKAFFALCAGAGSAILFNFVGARHVIAVRGVADRLNPR